LIAAVAGVLVASRMDDSLDGQWAWTLVAALAIGYMLSRGLAKAGSGRRPVVVVDTGGGRAALIADTLLGQQDVVVEQLAAPAGLPAWVGGVTILPDGAPALILDPAALF